MKKNLSSVKLRNYISKFQVGTYKKNTVKTAGFSEISRRIHSDVELATHRK